MYETYEIFTLLTGVAIVLFIPFFRKAIAREPFSKWLLASFFFFILSRFFTVIEGLFLENLFNHLEHLCYLAFSLALFKWVVKHKREAGS